MKRPAIAIGMVGLLLGFVCGCATPDVNPPTARTGRGYVDLYTMPKSEVWWKVDVFDPGRQGYKEFTAQFKAPGEGIFRVEARPGRHKARISFVNQAIEAPAEIEVEVREGMITPVKVTLEQGDSTYVRIVEDRPNVFPRMAAVLRAVTVTGRAHVFAALWAKEVVRDEVIAVGEDRNAG